MCVCCTQRLTLCVSLRLYHACIGDFVDMCLILFTKRSVVVVVTFFFSTIYTFNMSYSSAICSFCQCSFLSFVPFSVQSYAIVPSPNPFFCQIFFSPFFCHLSFLQSILLAVVPCLSLLLCQLYFFSSSFCCQLYPLPVLSSASCTFFQVHSSVTCTFSQSTHLLLLKKFPLYTTLPLKSAVREREQHVPIQNSACEER